MLKIAKDSQIKSMSKCCKKIAYQQQSVITSAINATWAIVVLFKIQNKKFKNVKCCNKKEIFYNIVNDAIKSLIKHNLKSTCYTNPK